MLLNDNSFYDNQIARAVASDTTPRRWICKYGGLSLIANNYKRCKHLIPEYKEILAQNQKIMKGKLI